MSSARDEILAAVRKARPPAVPAPDVGAAVRAFQRSTVDHASRFTDTARAAGSVVVEGRREDVPGSVALPSDPRMLANLDIFVCEAELGVAESGALWITAPRTLERAALFLAAEVVVVLDRRTIVPDLHAAYARLDVGAVSFGVFVAGPSKTADIEQSLVIGAHGPKQLTIFVV